VYRPSLCRLLFIVVNGHEPDYYAVVFVSAVRASPYQPTTHAAACTQ
jgi:hypothetical protein